MLSKIYQHIKFKQICIFFVEVQAPALVYFTRYDIVVKDKKINIATISDSFENDISQLLDNLPSHIPVCLYLKGKGLVQRIFNKENISDISTEELYPKFKFKN